MVLAAPPFNLKRSALTARPLAAQLAQVAQPVAGLMPQEAPSMARSALAPVKAPGIAAPRFPGVAPVARGPLGPASSPAALQPSIERGASITRNPLAPVAPESARTDFGGLLANVAGAATGLARAGAGNAFTPADPADPTNAASGTTSVPEALSSMYSNGKLGDDALTSIGQGGHRLYTPAATAWQSLVAAAAADGINLTITDSYRTYDEQVDLAKRKGLYSQGGLAAVPGTSKHGWGLAVDVNVNDPKALAWIQANAARFGFGQPGGPGGSFSKKEPWHWEYQGGGSAPKMGGGGASMGASPSALQQQAMQQALGGLTGGIQSVAGNLGQLSAANAGAGVSKGISKLLHNPYVTQNPYLNQSPTNTGGLVSSGISGLLQAAGQTIGGGGSGQSGTVGFGAVQNPNAKTYNAQQIAQVAYNAGFRGDNLRKMVAIAMAESGGNVGAHNPKGEDSRGLWQVNVDAHGEKYGNLYDPQINANAAYDIWQNAGGFGPWTVTHDSRGAPYKQYLDDALAALQALGYL